MQLGATDGCVDAITGHTLAQHPTRVVYCSLQGAWLNLNRVSHQQPKQDWTVGCAGFMKAQSMQLTFRRTYISWPASPILKMISPGIVSTMRMRTAHAARNAGSQPANNGSCAHAHQVWLVFMTVQHHWTAVECAISWFACVCVLLPKLECTAGDA